MRIFAFTLLLGLSARAHGQQALVLSGGGSRGSAHAGVLLVLEERGYDPDLVVGTSMGAVVGALYAAGYEPEEIVQRLKEVEWRGMFEPTPVIVGVGRAVRYPMLTIDLDVAGLRFSRGVVGQWRINRALARLLFEANARSRGDFDKLPRRYRAIVADLRTGEAIALDSGDLALAVRASMSVPGFFAPIEWGDRVLVDGGIAANLPTGTARRLGAAYVIAVDVARPPPELHSLAPLAVVQRALDHMQANAQRDTVPPDALVVPAIEPGFSGANFPADPSGLIELGRSAARRDLPIAPPRPGIATRTPGELPDSFGALVIEAPDSALASFARALFHGSAPGRYDANAIAAAVDRLYATGLLEGVWPRVEQPNADEPATLVLRLVGQPKVSLSVAAHFENDRGGRAWGALERASSFGRRPGVLSAAASVGGLERSASLSARILANAGGIAWSIGAFGKERAVRFFDEDLTGSKEVLHGGGWAAVELPHILRERFSVAAVRGEWIDEEDGANGWSFGPVLRWSAVEPPVFVVGLPFGLEAEQRFGDFTYTRIAASGSWKLSLNALQLAALGDFQLVDGAAPADVLPALGDDHLIPGLRWGERRDRVRAAAGIDVAYPLYTGFVRLRLRTGAVANGIARLDDSGWISGGQLGVYFPTPLGALDVAYASATRGGGRFEVSIGQRF
ncbi:MAG: patatin-like phospholipase family protein [Gemmatimonadota bacterium]